jgi:hypothetical protein
MSTTPDHTESQGLPNHADDTSTAWDDPRHPDFDDSPPALPADEPQGLDDYGLTPDEEARDEPLRARMLREEPEIALADGPDVVDGEPVGVGDEFGETLSLDDPPVEVGRLIATGDDPYADDEAQAIAEDTGERQGLTPEEAAMHIVPGERVPYE